MERLRHNIGAGPLGGSGFGFRTGAAKLDMTYFRAATPPRAARSYCTPPIAVRSELPIFCLSLQRETRLLIPACHVYAGSVLME